VLTLTALTCALTVVAFTARRVAGRVRDLAEVRAAARALRVFTDAVGRDLSVGARPVEAAGHGVAALAEAPEGEGRTGGAVVDRLRFRVGLVRLGADPAATGTVADSGRAGGASSAGGAGRTDAPDVTDQWFRLWAVADRHGLALGRLSDRMIEDLDARLTHLGHTSSALAGARLTETILLLLPVGALALGQSMGLSPFGFLTGNPLGVLLLLGGVVLACAGVLWAESLTVTVLGGVGRRAGPAGLAAAQVLDTFAESLVAGLPVADAWAAAAETGDGDGGGGGDGEKDLARVAALLSLGAGPVAWEPLRRDPAYGPVARQAAGQTRSGARLADGVRAQAARLRREAADRSLAASERVLVVVAAPLTLCFLPAFILVGLVPLVVGFAGI
jgi:tight adherence protein B